jgi:hypothetical protein
MVPDVRKRLDDTIAAVCPIHGTSGDQGSVRIDYKPEATAQQQTDAQSALAAFDWSQAAHDAWLNLKDRTAASTKFDAVTAEAKALRAIASVLIDELNAIRQWLVAFKSATAASTNYATLKSGIGGLSNMPDRTLAQAKTAIQNAINAGTVD